MCYDGRPGSKVIAGISVNSGETCFYIYHIPVHVNRLCCIPSHIYATSSRSKANITFDFKFGDLDVGDLSCERVISDFGAFEWMVNRVVHTKLNFTRKEFSLAIATLISHGTL